MIFRVRQFVCPRVLAFAVVVFPLHAQAPTPIAFLDVGSERERSLRVLQITGAIPLYPWTVRALGPVDVEHLAPVNSPAGLWGVELGTAAGVWHGARWEVLPIQVPTAYNSTFPYGIDDGPIWAGRGVTVAVEGGAALRAGPLSIQLEPLLFDAQNQSFTLRPTNRPANGAYANGVLPDYIDLPQRFGNEHYARLDPGQSTIRLDLGPVAAAFSTANQFWGPALQNPVILGDNAAGFPHLFIGASRPLDIGVGHLFGRVVWGRLDQTPYSPRGGDLSRRLMTGGLAAFVPRFVPGLELGATRFTHTRWPEDGPLSRKYVLKPFSGLFAPTDNPGGPNGDNILASLFFRWTFPPSGFEVYGEYGRDDAYVDLRDLSQEPDHSGAYLIGFQRAWRQGATGLVVVRGELLNTRISHLGQGRPAFPWYAHGGIAQGHTQDGQLLGSPGGFGGGASVLAVDRYTSDGRWTVTGRRMMRGENILATGGDLLALPNPHGADVLYTLGVERLRRLPHFELTTGVTGVLDLNRDFMHDQFSLNLQFAFRAPR